MSRCLVALVVLLLIGSGHQVGAESVAHAQQGQAAGRYIVVLRPDVADPAAVAAELGQARGLTIRHVYETALKGFAAEIPAAAVDAIQRNPRVAFVEPDRSAELAVQTLPTGVDRVDADLDATAAIDGNVATGGVDVAIAVLDTGIDLGHADLNVAGGVDCVPGDGKNSYADDHGHGTHVAGIAGARDTTIDTVGVAPGAPIIPATSTVRYGVNGARDQVVTDDRLTTDHSIRLRGLKRKTTYTFVVESTANGQTTRTGEGTFTTT